MGVALYLDCLECEDKACKKQYKYNKIVIGIDQSYTSTGISICADGKLLKVTSIDFKGLKIKSEKRKHLSNILYRILKLNSLKASECLIICERIRTFSQGHLSPAYLISTGALIGSIVDTAYDFDVPVYSVDTRSWKSQVVGTNKIAPRHKHEIKPEKMATIEFVERLGFDLKLYNKDGSIKKSVRGKNKGKIKYNDDAADSACIALYAFIPVNKQKLQLEE